MITIRAPADCTLCKNVPAQGRLPNGKPVCVSCALVGTAMQGNTIHTNGIVSAFVYEQNEEPATGTIEMARRELKYLLGDDFEKEYNQYANQMHNALARRAVTMEWLRTDMVPVLVRYGALAAHADHLFEEWEKKKTPAAQQEFVDVTAEALVSAMVAAKKGVWSSTQARAMLIRALGPFKEDSVSIAGDLCQVGDEVADALWRDISHVYKLDRSIKDALVDAWTSALLADSGSDMSLGEAIVDANEVLSNSVMEKFADRVLARVKVASDFLRKRYDAQSMPAAYDEPISPDAIATGTALLAVADLRDPAVLTGALDVVVTRVGARRGGKQVAASRLLTYFSGLSGDARVGAELIDCTLIGADAIQHVDASLLRRAKEAMKKRTADKQYSTLVMEKELIKLWSTKMARNGTREEYVDWARENIPDTVLDQPAFRRDPIGFRNFVLSVGNEFYRDGKPLPAVPERVEMTQDEFVGKNRGQPNWQVIGDQLVNMSEYLNRRDLQKQNIPPTREDIIGPSGLSSVNKTPKRAEVVADVQQMRRSLITQLQKVAASKNGIKGQRDGIYPAMAEVDQVLARIFQGLWEALPADVKDGAAMETFPGIMEEYQMSKGTPVQRRGNMITRFLKRK